MLETCPQFKISFAPKHMVLPGNFRRSRRTPKRCARTKSGAECLMRAVMKLLFLFAMATLANWRKKRGKQMKAKALDVMRVLFARDFPVYFCKLGVYKNNCSLNILYVMN